MDADRKEYTFKFWYKPMYIRNSEWLTCLFDFDNMICRNGYQITLQEEIKFDDFDDKKVERIRNFIEKNNDLKKAGFYPFRLSGDADFQTYDQNHNKERKMHMFPNFSLIPVTGALNNIKGRLALPIFLERYLKKYFETREIDDMPYRKMGPKCKDIDRIIVMEKEALKAFFDIFDSLDEYCKGMYFLDEKMICNSFANSYWNAREQIAEKCGISKEMLMKDINREEFT